MEVLLWLRSNVDSGFSSRSRAPVVARRGEFGSKPFCNEPKLSPKENKPRESAPDQVRDPALMPFRRSTHAHFCERDGSPRSLTMKSRVCLRTNGGKRRKTRRRSRRRRCTAIVILRAVSTRPRFPRRHTPQKGKGAPISTSATHSPLRQALCGPNSSIPRAATQKTANM